MTIATPAAARSASRGSSRVSSIFSPDRTTSPKARSHVTGVRLAGTPCRVASAWLRCGNRRARKPPTRPAGRLAAAAAGGGAATADAAERPPSVLQAGARAIVVVGSGPAGARRLPPAPSGGGADRCPSTEPVQGKEGGTAAPGLLPLVADAV